MGLELFIVQYPRIVRVRTTTRPVLVEGGERATNEGTPEAPQGGDVPGLGSPAVSGSDIAGLVRQFVPKLSRSKRRGSTSSLTEFDVVVEAPDETPAPDSFGAAALSNEGPQDVDFSGGSNQLRMFARPPSRNSSHGSDLSSASNAAPRSERRGTGSDGNNTRGAAAPQDLPAEHDAAAVSAHLQEVEDLQGPGDVEDEATPADKKKQQKKRGDKKRLGAVEEEGDLAILDVDRLVRKEVAWLKHDGYLAGAASYHLGTSNLFMAVIFPCDTIHVAFVLTALEDLGLGTDFGSVVILPTTAGVTSYRYQGLNDPDAKAAKARAEAIEPDGRGVCGGLLAMLGIGGRALDTTTARRGRIELPFGTDEDDEDSMRAQRGWQIQAAKELQGTLFALEEWGPNGIRADDELNVEEEIESAQERERMKARRNAYITRASCVRVEQLVETVENNAKPNFDYFAYLIIASVLAAVGLGLNQDPVIVASMLVSPLMGPIMAFTLAVNLRRRHFATNGALTFLLSLVIMITIGFTAALIGVNWVKNPDDWPTQSMKNRGGRTTLLAGIVVAIFSGAGVALSMLSENSASLVGVAISASLLPPAVNCGMAWATAAVSGAIKPEHDWDTWTWFKLGSESLLLVVLNVVGVAGAACLMFWLKEVVPKSARTVSWHHDLKVARELKLQGLQQGLEDQHKGEADIHKAAQAAVKLHTQ